jgi:hypothetical protein
MAMDIVAPAISVKTVALNYYLGEYKLATSRLSMQVYQFYLTDPAPARLQPITIPARLDGVLLGARPLPAKLPQITIQRQMIRYVAKQYEHFFTDLTLGEEEYLARFSAKSRSTLKRKVRKLARASGEDEQINWSEYKTPDELKIFYPLARGISRKTYQERLLKAGLPDTSRFYQTLMCLAAADSVRGYLLFMQDKPLAYMYCPISDGVLSYDYQGYDPDYADWSPGTVLQWLVLQHLFREGNYRLFDFTEGEGPHKAFFASGNRLCANIYYLRLTAANLLRVCMHAGLNKSSAKIVGTLDRFGLKTTIKKTLRALASAPANENAKGSL